jgi:hypothetical protein
MAALAADLMAFDDSPDGERLRRFDMANGRGLSRSLAELRRHRRDVKAGSGLRLSVVSGPLSVVSDPLADARGNGECAGEANVSNEATGGPLSVVSGPPLSVVSGPLSVVSDPLANASGDDEFAEDANVSNEAIGGPLSVVSSPLSVPSGDGERARGANESNQATHAWQNATNEPTGSHENATNESTVAHENTTNEPTGSSKNVTNEATDAPENATNEPSLALESVVDQSVEPNAGRDDRGEEGLEEGFSVKASESIRAGNARIRRTREEYVRKLNEEARKEAEQAMAIRRSRLREQRNNQGKPARQPKGQTASGGHGPSSENAARKKDEHDEFEKNALGLFDELYPALG